MFGAWGKHVCQILDMEQQIWFFEIAATNKMIEMHKNKHPPAVSILAWFDVKVS